MIPIYDCVTPLIAIMKDQVEHLHKVRVAAAMMGEDVDFSKTMYT